MLDFLMRLLGTADGSKSKAKERLKLVLVHDRSSLSPGLLDALKEELIQVISKYMEIDESGLEVTLDQSDSSAALVANIPVKSVRRQPDRAADAQSEAPAKQPAAAQANGPEKRAPKRK